MKKILGLVAMALLLGGPAFAANTSVINYTLEIGGDNHAATYESSLAPPQFSPGQTTIFTVPNGTTVVTWDVAVAVSGTVDLPTLTDAPVFGAGNLVWSLELYDSTNALVAIGAATIACDSGTIDSDCLNAHPTNAGFFSTINDGDKDGTNNHLDLRQLAAFAYSFRVSGADPYARVSDTVASNGPNMGRSQPPSAAGFPAASTAALGKLVGMGAGYTEFKGSTGPAEVGGVGMTGGECQLAAPPVAEGQISLKGLASGTYTLKIVPGQGNNVICWNDYCNADVPGRFAFAANSVTTSNGGQVQFIYTAPPAFGTLAVALQTNGTPPGPAGSAWSIDAGATWHTEASLPNVPVGTYTVSFKPVTGYTTPADQAGVAITDGGTASVTGNYISALPKPPMASVVSTRRHGNGGTIPYFNCSLPVAISPSGANSSVEPRGGTGPWSIDVTYAANIGGTPAVSVSAGTAGTPTIAGAVLSIPITTMPDKTCLTITINGVTAAGGTLTGTDTIKLLVLRGDVSGDHVVGALDMAQVKSHTSSAAITCTNSKWDISCDGTVGALDMAQVKSSTSSTNYACTIP